MATPRRGGSLNVRRGGGGASAPVRLNVGSGAPVRGAPAVPGRGMTMPTTRLGRGGASAITPTKGGKGGN